SSLLLAHPPPPPPTLFPYTTLFRSPADERAAGELAAPRDALDDFGGGRDVELAAGEIVEKEKRLSALREDVVDAHRNEIDAHCRSEEHTSELQSRFDLVCRLLLEKK